MLGFTFSGKASDLLGCTQDTVVKALKKKHGEVKTRVVLLCAALQNSQLLPTRLLAETSVCAMGQGTALGEETAGQSHLCSWQDHGADPPEGSAKGHGK